MLEQLFFEVCPGCAEASRAGLCAVCAAALLRVADACERCGLGRPVASCPRRGRPWHVERVLAPFEYSAPLDGYVHALKYRGARRLGRTLALALARRPARRGPRRRRARAGAAAPSAASRARLQPGDRDRAHARPRARTADVARRDSPSRRASGYRPGTAPRSALENVARAFGSSATSPACGSRSSTTSLTTGATVNALAARCVAPGRPLRRLGVARTPEGRAEMARSFGSGSASNPSASALEPLRL